MTIRSLNVDPSTPEASTWSCGAEDAVQKSIETVTYQHAAIGKYRYTKALVRVSRADVTPSRSDEYMYERNVGIRVATEAEAS